jgi:hypothetical protein
MWQCVRGGRGAREGGLVLKGGGVRERAAGRENGCSSLLMQHGAQTQVSLLLVLYLSRQGFLAVPYVSLVQPSDRQPFVVK